MEFYTSMMMAGEVGLGLAANEPGNLEKKTRTLAGIMEI
jgi:hypothetical protein